MRVRLITGTKKEIAEKVAEFDGEILEAIVFVDDAPLANENGADIFAEMAPFTVQQEWVNDSRDAIYQRVDNE